MPGNLCLKNHSKVLTNPPYLFRWQQEAGHPSCDFPKNVPLVSSVSLTIPAALTIHCSLILRTGFIISRIQARGKADVMFQSCGLFFF